MESRIICAASVRVLSFPYIQAWEVFLPMQALRVYSVATYLFQSTSTSCMNHQPSDPLPRVAASDTMTVEFPETAPVSLNLTSPGCDTWILVARLVEKCMVGGCWHLSTIMIGRQNVRTMVLANTRLVRLLVHHPRVVRAEKPGC